MLFSPCFSPTGAVTWKERKVRRLPDNLLGLLSLSPGGRELLALSCTDKISLLTVSKGSRRRKFRTAFRFRSGQYGIARGAKVGGMCAGDADRLFVQSDLDEVLEFDTSTTPFR